MTPTMLRYLIFVSIISSLVTACGGNLQDNPLAVPVQVNRKVVAVDTFGIVPTSDNVGKSSVLFRFSAPKSQEFVPITAYNGSSIWFISSYEAASTMAECTGFLKDWSSKINPNWVKRGFCAVRSPQSRGEEYVDAFTDAKI